MKFHTASVVTLGVIVGTQSLSIIEMVIWAGVLSFIGGVASSLRREDAERPWLTLIQYGCNTAVMGASAAMMSWYWVAERPTATWFVVGACGAISLGGLASVDWFFSLVKKKVEKRADDES